MFACCRRLTGLSIEALNTFRNSKVLRGVPHIAGVS